ncbi:hypothetical protein QQZ08_010658 [Neonectria magnoliae]|uniref:Uncharacterized protein n=1 Tax=Neonectria magnoliae TaxID=2732573 RepID=A0ABR1HFX4_9HYPO
MATENDVNPSSDPVPLEKAEPTTIVYKTLASDFAVLFADASGPVVATADSNTWIGLQLEIPLGHEQEDNENAGFGVRHIYDRAQSRVAAFDQHRIVVKFPRGQCSYLFEEVDPKLIAWFPDAKEVESWVNENAPIVEAVTLLDVLQLNEVFVVVPRPIGDARKEFDEGRLPPPFIYPYGTEHSWNEDRYEQLLIKTKSKKQLQPAYRYNDDNSHIAVVTQYVVRDIMWIEQAADEIRREDFAVYFVPIDPVDPAEAMRFYLIVPPTQEFRDRFEDAWRRLTKSDVLHVILPDVNLDPDVETSRWPCAIGDHAQGIDAFKDHPQAKPSHEIPGGANDMMDLHRALMRGTGFFNRMMRPPVADLVEAMAALSLDPSLEALPRVDRRMDCASLFQAAPPGRALQAHPSTPVPCATSR